MWITKLFQKDRFIENHSALNELKFIQLIFSYKLNFLISFCSKLNRIYFQHFLVFLHYFKKHSVTELFGTKCVKIENDKSFDHHSIHY